MKRFSLISILTFVLSAQAAVAQNEAKTGWTFGLLPSIAYDADLGFQYGALTNIYYYGDGSTYPEYLHSIYLEANRTTKKKRTFQAEPRLTCACARFADFGRHILHAR